MSDDEYHHELGNAIRKLANTADMAPTYPAMQDLDTLETYLREVRADLEAAEMYLQARKRELGEE